jgi:hypothetical protein
MHTQIVRMLERINVYERINLPRKWVFVHTHDGVRAALAALALLAQRATQCSARGQ